MKNVFITGGSRGIGKACVRRFTGMGYKVFFTYSKNSEKAKKLSAETGALSLKADVSNSNEVTRAADFVLESCGGVDILINNAGISQQKLFTDITENDWDRMFDVNIKGMFLTSRVFVPGMINKKYGKIVNISSMWGVTGGSCEVHYSASKAAVIGFTKSLAKELGPSGINVNCIAPGVINTDMNGNLSAEDIKALTGEAPLERIGASEEVAEAVVFLCGDGAEFITGQVLNVDGGMVI